jgi:hypothetical protein
MAENLAAPALFILLSFFLLPSSFFLMTDDGWLMSDDNRSTINY